MDSTTVRGSAPARASRPWLGRPTAGSWPRGAPMPSSEPGPIFFFKVPGKSLKKEKCGRWLVDDVESYVIF